MIDSLVKLRDDYLIQKNQEFKNNSLARYVRREIPKIIGRGISFNEQYKIFGSVGQGNWAEIPWIAIFDKEVTTSAMKGFYIVYLFSSDMKRVYLSLNQGYTFFENNYGRKEGYKKIKEVASKYRHLLSKEIDQFNLSEISLNSKQKLAVGYEKGHICGKEYDLYNLPNNRQLFVDLNQMIRRYYKLKALLNNDNDYDKALQELFYYDSITYDTDEDKIYLSIVKEAPKEILDEPKERTIRENNVTGAYKRNSQVAANALYKANYICEFDKTHSYFITRRNNKNYVEAHHLIPMKYQDEFEYRLDVESNIVALCPVCHRILHHGELKDITFILEKLFKSRVKRLEKSKLVVSFEKLIEFYN